MVNNKATGKVDAAHKTSKAAAKQHIGLVKNDSGKLGNSLRKVNVD